MGARIREVHIYSDNCFFIMGVKGLVEEVFGDCECAFITSPEVKILELSPEYLYSSRARRFIFVDVRNRLLLPYLNFLCNRGIIRGDSKVSDIRRVLLSGRRKYNTGNFLQLRELSVREREIVVCMKLKMTDDEIASGLNLSKKTVSAHRRNILLKLGISNRSELYRHLFCFENR
ncbi:LuxR C-terminal-related transcriptional regulator [Escherichia coli]|nr:LuxR C-terminal-related transcriptional regulator [Escherichia coli]